MVGFQYCHCHVRNDKFTLAGFPPQSLYYPKIMQITAIKIIIGSIHCSPSPLDWSFFFVVFVGRTKEKDFNKCK
jgi:hypothetical protein